MDRNCFEKVGLFLSARNLPKMDLMRLSNDENMNDFLNPRLYLMQSHRRICCCVHSESTNKRAGKDSQHSESIILLVGNLIFSKVVVKDTENPDWPGQITVEYYFEMIQQVWLEWV